MSNKFFDNSLNIFFFKKLSIPLSLNIEIFFFNNFKILILNNHLNKKIYLVLPQNLKFLFFNKNLFFIFINLKISKNFFFIYKYKNFFFSNLLKTIFSLYKFIAKTLFIRGIGLRINFLEDSINTLKLKLGYSHFIYLKYSNDLIISLFKKKILIRSFNTVLLGNFCIVLKKFRPINVFTGKGLHIKRSKFKLKSYIKKI
jgi:hypothetical protein